MIRSRSDNGANDTNFEAAGSINVRLATSGNEPLKGLVEFDLGTVPAAGQID